MEDFVIMSEWDFEVEVAEEAMSDWMVEAFEEFEAEFEAMIA